MRILQPEISTQYKVSRMSICRSHEPQWRGATEINIIFTHASYNTMPQIEMEFIRDENHACILTNVSTSVANVHILPLLERHLQTKCVSLILEFFS